jgi:uroporphyrinogen III methyltransferase/synthase
VTGSGERHPLALRRILVTRRGEQSATLASGLASLGATVVEVPTLEVVPPADPAPFDRALEALHRFDWLVFTSANAVHAVAQRMRTLGLDSAAVGRALAVASVGSATSEAFRGSFPEAEVALQPTAGFKAAALLEAFAIRGCAGQSVLLPASDRARDVLPRGLLALGARVEHVVAYRTVEPDGLAGRIAAALGAGIDLVVFASPSAVEGFLAAAGDGARGLAAAVIGPVTEAAARAGGLDVRVVAAPATAEGLVSAVAAAFGGGGSARLATGGH